MYFRRLGLLGSLDGSSRLLPLLLLLLLLQTALPLLCLGSLQLRDIYSLPF
eukprot:COSAG06_NODE_2783_length_6290_cov_3.541916_12_plen_51_part_00